MIGLVECIILGWMYKLHKLREHANKTSDILISRWWDILIKYFIPFILIIILIVAIVDNIINPYLGHQSWIIIIGGVTPCILIFLLSIFLMKLNSKEKKI
jgi:NSS family neurotransmitter:Na+ symporter